MTIFWSILLNNVLPLSVMIAIGITLQRAFSLDIKTLSKLNFYLVLPSGNLSDYCTRRNYPSGGWASTTVSCSIYDSAVRGR